MSVKPRSRQEIPENTRVLGEKLLSKTNVYRVIGAEFWEFATDEDFLDLYSAEGKPAISPSLLAMVCCLQAMESLSDREAAERVVTGIDWKYALHLDLGDEGFNFSVLSEFRWRLIKHEKISLVFDKLLGALQTRGLVHAKKQRIDSIAILMRAGHLTRLELMHESLRVCVEAVVVASAEWVKQHVPRSMLERYQSKQYADRMVRTKGAAGQAELRKKMHEVGQDGAWLLMQISDPKTPPEFKALPEVKRLETVWTQQFDIMQEQVRVKEVAELVPSAARIVSPHDPDARFKAKRDVEHEGFKTHVTETVPENSADAPRLVTNVTTTSATEHDSLGLAGIQAELGEHGVAPKTLCADAGYVNGNTLEASNKLGIELLGPVQGDSSAQAKHGLGLQSFVLDYDKQVAICPQGHSSVRWSKNQLDPDAKINISFSRKVCEVCPVFKQCVTGTTHHERHLSVSKHHDLVRQRRAEQSSQPFLGRYRHRAGIEATLSMMIRKYDMRQARTIGQQSVGLRIKFIGAAINLKRSALWIAGQRQPVRPATHVQRLLNATA